MKLLNLIKGTYQKPVAIISISDELLVGAGLSNCLKPIFIV